MLNVSCIGSGAAEHHDLESELANLEGIPPQFKKHQSRTQYDLSIRKLRSGMSRNADRQVWMDHGIAVMNSE